MTKKNNKRFNWLRTYEAREDNVDKALLCCFVSYVIDKLKTTGYYDRDEITLDELEDYIDLFIQERKLEI